MSINNQKSLIDLIDELISSEGDKLPAFPSIISQFNAARTDPRASADTFVSLIEQDPSLAVQVLRVANSPYYARLNKVTTIKASVMRLGIMPVVQIAVMVAQRENFKSTDPFIARHLNNLWRHSVACATGSEWLAQRLGFAQIAGEAFMAGLFHDIGKLLLLKCIEDIRKNQTVHFFSEELVFEILDSLHHEKGAHFLEKSGLPEAYCKIALTHHQEISDKTGTVDLIVRVADMVSRKMGIALREEKDLMVTSTEEAALLGVSGVIVAELEVSLEDSMSVAA